jgi:hypothetical protein
VAKKTPKLKAGAGQPTFMFSKDLATQLLLDDKDIQAHTDAKRKEMERKENFQKSDSEGVLDEHTRGQ